MNTQNGKTPFILKPNPFEYELTWEHHQVLSVAAKKLLSKRRVFKGI